MFLLLLRHPHCPIETQSQVGRGRVDKLGGTVRVSNRGQTIPAQEVCGSIDAIVEVGWSGERKAETAIRQEGERAEFWRQLRLDSYRGRKDRYRGLNRGDGVVFPDKHMQDSR